MFDHRGPHPGELGGAAASGYPYGLHKCWRSWDQPLQHEEVSGEQADDLMLSRSSSTRHVCGNAQGFCSGT